MILEGNGRILLVTNAAKRIAESFTLPIDGLSFPIFKAVMQIPQAVRDMVQTGRIKLLYCPTENIIANILTKGLPINRNFVNLLDSLNCPTEIKEEC